MGRKVWVLFTAKGNPHVYTFHGVFDQPGKLEQVKEVLGAHRCYVKEVELNDRVDEPM